MFTNAIIRRSQERGRGKSKGQTKGQAVPICHAHTLGRYCVCLCVIIMNYIINPHKHGGGGRYPSCGMPFAASNYVILSVLAFAYLLAFRCLRC